MDNLEKLAISKGFDSQKFEYYYPWLCFYITLQEWLRIKHKLYIIVIPTETCNWTYKICSVAEPPIETPPYKETVSEDWSSYELALRAALLDAIKQI